MKAPRLTASLLLAPPTMVIGFLPISATIDDLVRRDRPTWSWVEWVGMATAGSCHAFGILEFNVDRWLNGQGSLLIPLNALVAATTLLWLILSLLLARTARKVGFDSRSPVSTSR